jgi:tetratricopeptide (TPR) repeat protein
MAVPIEGYSVVAQKARIEHLLENDAIEIPNATALGDDDIWRCCFMAEADALEFIQSLEKLDLNVSQGPDSDVVLVNEFDRSVSPYCEWLVTAKWEKAVIAWKAGTRPESVVAREGWDPKTGSGLSFHDPSSLDNLEFLRLKDNVEVYLNKDTGKEVYIGRTSTPVEAMFKTATQVIGKYLVTAGEKPVSGQEAETVAGAVQMLEEVIAQVPDWWNALWYHGKGQIALGNYELAYQSLRRAYELEKNVEAVPRELAGVCLELGKFDEAVSVAEQATALDPDNVGLIGNLALAYLLAGRIGEAKKSIASAIKIEQNDKINNYLDQIIAEVADGRRPQPKSLADLSSTPAKPKRRFWEFWKD